MTAPGGAATDSDECLTRVIDRDRVDATQSLVLGRSDAGEVAELFRLLGDPGRVQMLCALLEAGELCVCDLAAVVDMTESSVSHSLRLLRTAGIVRHRRSGRRVFYRLDDAHVRLLLDREHRARQSRAGGLMTEKVVLDLPVLLPDALDGRDRCVVRLTKTLTAARGVDEVHLVDAGGGAPARLCLHIDPATTSVSRVRSLAEGAGAELTEQFGHVLWPVTGINHVRKARSVAEALRRVDGVAEAEIAPGLVRVEFDQTRLQEQELRAVLGGHGVDSKTDGDGHEGDDHAEGAHVHGGPFGERSELIFAITSMALWTLGFVLELTTEIGEGVLTGLFVTAGFFGGYFTLREAIESIRNRRFEIDILMLVAAAGAAALGKWEEGALLLALFSIGHALEGYALGRARRAIEALAELAPSTAVVRDADGEQEVPVEELRLGDTVVVKPNERIPADGFVLTGTSSVDQSSLTGESIPVDKAPVADAAAAAEDPTQVPASSQVFSGTINGAGQLDLQVTRLSSDSTLAKLATMVREAETQASPTQRFTDRFERVFVPVVLGLVVVLLAVGPLVGSSWSESFYRAMAVLVAASPCALAIATPSVVLSGRGPAGQDGVLVKGEDRSNLGTRQAIAFDKTGTLTEGRPRADRRRAGRRRERDELLTSPWRSRPAATTRWPRRSCRRVRTPQRPDLPVAERRQVITGAGCARPSAAPRC